MKPKEIASLFSDFLEEGSTPKGMKVQAFFNHLTPSVKAVFARNVSKAYASHLEGEKLKADLRKKKRKEIAELKKRAKELGFVISQP